MGKNPPKPVQKTSPSSSQDKPKVKSTGSTSQPDPSSSSSSSKTVKNKVSDSEPPAKKNRSEVKNETPSTSGTTNPDESNSRTSRRALKSEATGPKCSFCKLEQKPESEPLKKCAKCTGQYHITKCLRYRGEIAANIAKNDEWRCPRCVVCDECKKFISDPSNIECTECCKAWHGACAKRGYCPSNEWDSAWFCNKCCKTRNFKLSRDTAITHHVTSVWPKSRKGRDKRELVFGEKAHEDIISLLNRRDHLYDTLKYEAGLTENKPSGIPKRPEASTSAASSSSYSFSLPSSSSSKSKKKDNKKKGSSSEDTQEAEDCGDVDFVLPDDRDLFYKSLSDAYPPEASSSAPNREQWLHFGTGRACKAIYQSAYEEPLQSAPHLYSCKFCLQTSNRQEDFLIHANNCVMRHPPGNEIYRHEVDGISFFEVDGADQKKYCQDLCLLAKLFISSKTLYTEVETFIFYVLCEITSEGFVIVGYFSKEKNPSKNNNLSCLLVLPMVQNMGYGRLLIDMSYELSRIEHRVGHPEHPLSDLGILAYRGYWRSSLLCYLRSMHTSDRVNLKDMCLATRIAQVDIVNQLMLDNIVVHKNGVYSLKIGKRALKFPLSMSRRRAVDRQKIVWTANPEDPPLDPTRINTYV